MPKIKDLGVKVIPETMRPPEMGPGGGGPHCNPTNCALSFCFCSLVRSACGCTQNHCTHEPTFVCQPTICAIPTVCHAPTLFCQIPSACACTAIQSIPCGGSGCGAVSPVCGGSIVDPGGPITREQIGTLKDHLRQQLDALDQAEKNLGPKTTEAIDARTKQIEDELAQLKQRRKDLEKK